MDVFFYVQKLVTGLTVRDNDQLYEVLGLPLFDPTACGTHRASQERQTSGVACVGFDSKSEDCAKRIRVQAGLPVSGAIACLEKLPL